MKRKVTVGDWVRLTPGRRFSHQNLGRGKIVTISNLGWYVVEFTDGYENTYEAEDLTLTNISLKELINNV